MISVPEYTNTHFAGGAMRNYVRSIFSSSCSVPIWIFISGTKKQQKQNNQSISDQLSQTNIHLSKINFTLSTDVHIAYNNCCARRPTIHPNHNALNQLESSEYHLHEFAESVKRWSVCFWFVCEKRKTYYFVRVYLRCVRYAMGCRNSSMHHYIYVDRS